ncbi:MAG: hypothetical protein HYY52_06200 [Candidatus Melainabacteria bacterium]|nr:hypothetical protein [Candidatus Melainabacteria bacterium]
MMKINSEMKNKIGYTCLIAFIWLAAYLVFQFAFEQKLGWDEIAYMSVARGIAQDFDFGSRAYTIMGLLKYGYPTNLINYPIHAAYIAVFFKLFGVSQQVAYFSTWFAALGVCILIYFTFLLLSENNHKLSFLVSMSYLFCPGILKNCDTGMMEQFGCFLILFFVYLVLRDYAFGRFTYFTVLKFALLFLVLWLYKSLFIGVFFGGLVFIFLAYNSKITGKELATKISLPVFILLAYGTFALLYFILQKYIFLPVAPMMNFSPEQEISQQYADFLGGYFNDFPNNFLKNIIYFFQQIVGPYFIYPTNFFPYTGEILNTTGYFVFDGIYYFLLFLMIILSFVSWGKFSPVSKVFVGFVLVMIVSFNLIFIVLFKSYHSNIWRYNTYYLPVYLCCLWLIFKTNLEYIKPFYNSHPIDSQAILLLFIVFLYVPLFLSTLIHYLYNEDYYHVPAREKAKLIETFIGGARPKFIYYNDGTHTTFVSYPTRQIFKDATDAQLLQVNKILPEPIEFLFLRPTDWILQNNKEKIIKGEPILDGKYNLYGYSEKARVVVYKFNRALTN